MSTEFIENGIRFVQLEVDGEPFVVAEDFARWIASLDNEKIENEQKRAAHRMFQLALPLMDPAVAYAEAVKLLEACGGRVPTEFHRLRPRAVPESGE